MCRYGRAARPPSLLLVTGCWGAASPLDLVVCSVASGWETRPAVLLLRGVLPRFCTFGCAWLRWGCVGAALCPLQAAGRVPLFQVCIWGPCSRAGLLGGSSIAGPREPRGTLRQGGVCGLRRGSGPWTVPTFGSNCGAGEGRDSWLSAFPVVASRAELG